MPPHIHVGPIEPKHDYWGNRLTRPIAPGFIRESVIRFLRDPGNPLYASLAQLAGSAVDPAGVMAVKAVHFQEGDFQHIFRVRVTVARKREMQLAMVVAKDAGEPSRTADQEFNNLSWLHQHNSPYVVRPLSGGSLPVEVGEKRPARTVRVYFTEWLVGFHELGVDKKMNFFINEIPFHHFDRRVSDILKAEILKILFSCYDPDGRRAMTPPKIGAGDFVITRPRADRPYRLKLIACRKIIGKVSLGKCLRLYLGYHGTWGGRIFHFLPADYRLTHRAIREGLLLRQPDRISGADVQRELKRYAEDLSTGRAAADAWNPLAAIRPLLNGKLWKDAPI